jgi:arsenate reductase (thioredoxin)
MLRSRSMSERSYNVLFLCTGNSARSILAEAILGRLGSGRFRAFSAGSFPKGAVHPAAVRLLDQLDYDTSAFRSKSWDEFSGPEAPQLDFIFTVCGNAAGETCPVWPGKPMTAHWGLPDPAAVEGSEAEIAAAFADTYRMLINRIELFLALPLDAIDAMSLQNRLRDIGNTAGAEAVGGA